MTHHHSHEGMTMDATHAPAERAARLEIERLRGELMAQATAITPSHPAIDSASPCIKIDKGVPMPAWAPGRKPKYPWRQMAVGDSFVLGQSGKSIGKICTSAGLRTGWKFASRTVMENGERVIRVWRVA